MVRDKNRDLEHFLSYINTKTKSHADRIKKLELGQIMPDRITLVKQNMVTNLVQKLVAKFSAGLPVQELSEDFEIICNLITESWIGGVKKLVGKKSLILDQYSIDAHTQLLRILSIGFLLRLNADFFQRIASIIDTDNVIDIIFELILANKLVSRELRHESDSYAFELYKSLKKAIMCDDKNESERYVKTFLLRDWFSEQKKAQMITETNKDWYYGNWSFESAAVVVIKDLDDSSFRDNQFYPKDLVDYYRRSEGRIDS